MIVIWLIVAILVLLFLVAYWYITIPVAVFYAVVIVVHRAYGKNKKEKRISERNETRRTMEQRQMHSKLVSSCSQSIGAFQTLPKHLQSAERYLDRAEKHFTESAFAPFWDSIQRAATELARFDEGVQRIKRHAAYYRRSLRSYTGESGPVPEFPIKTKTVQKLSVGNAIAERFQSIVRKAQTNFQFALIYEQRKTNQILVAGFNDLAQAVSDLGWQISDSINEIDSSLKDLNMRMKSVDRTISEETTKTEEQMQEALRILNAIEKKIE